jgi:hypothetical protein
MKERKPSVSNLLSKVKRTGINLTRVDSRESLKSAKSTQSHDVKSAIMSKLGVKKASITPFENKDQSFISRMRSNSQTKSVEHEFIFVEGATKEERKQTAIAGAGPDFGNTLSEV